MLTCGIIGLAMAGKTTVFDLVTGAGAEVSRFPTGRTDTNTGVAVVPDRRIDALAELFNPKKTTYAQVLFSDVPGLARGASQGKGVGNQFLEGIRKADLLVHVVWAFRDPEVAHIEGSADPLRDIETVELELLLSDMELMERRLQRLEHGGKVSRENAAEADLLRKCLAGLNEGVPLHRAGLTDEESGVLKTFNLLTGKPVILVINTDEDQFRARDYPGKERVEHLAAERGVRVLEICGMMEAEIRRLSPDDRQLFMADLGIETPGVDRLIRAAYETLGLISFFTVGEDEVKAWTVSRGTDAREAAGKIHTSIERGFIRAEVAAYEDLIRLGSMARLREKGLARLEGKDYVVEDGDVIEFRFNV